MGDYSIEETPAAIKDIDEAFGYIAFRLGNPQAAFDLANDIYLRIQDLKMWQEMGLTRLSRTKFTKSTKFRQYLGLRALCELCASNKKSTPLIAGAIDCMPERFPVWKRDPFKS